MRHTRSAPDVPVVITTAATSLDDQFDRRRRKYLTMMGIRIVCVILAAVTFRTSIWLALAFMVGGAVLPWCAVLIANDRPAQRSTAFVRYHPPAAPINHVQLAAPMSPPSSAADVIVVTPSSAGEPDVQARPTDVHPGDTT